jgi:hypothetical protein
MYLPKAAGNIQVQVRNTTGLFVLNESKGGRSAGIYTLQVLMYSVPTGNYILNIWLDEHLISEIILKR